ncbi:MAG: Rrf2 family transcriptional regulator [Ekhidna sp.]
MFSRACEYAIKIMIYISANEKERRRTGLKEVTEAIASPEAFTAKILQQLVKSKLLNSYKGPTGGFELVVGKEIRLLDVVLAIDGSQILDACVLGLEHCSSAQPCPVHEQFLLVKEQLKETLLATDIRDNALRNSTINLK